ncbi:hypothetical protein H1R82_02620 [Thermoactinomyces intermedius]|uniref:Uncharacterized protein n=1 Tax=Thermoactinomyces intermedius TaxID=2024 RepID=A0A8I1A7E5_THEIN|nr:hypothetical protein [Thermoactinomyces intermedius]MBA4549176.1 hypothetical protein [Thermoactinomyces intermedius]MBA4835530.1 hypothetical protein [Thermoactinomyces intermedius]MBH8595808.1 hypothetical protein [Thermoactinomyces intermedius]
MKDPKQILESFRTDVQSRNLYSSLLRQFDLEYPNPRGNRRKPKPLAGKNVNQMAAALSVCLVTGLSAGVGTAFANSDFGPGQHPLDEPPSKLDRKIEQPQFEGKELERNLSDQPVELENKQETPKPEKDHQPTEKEFPSMKEIPEDIGKAVIPSDSPKVKEKEAVSSDKPSDMENSSSDEKRPPVSNLQEVPKASAQPESRQQEEVKPSEVRKESPVANQVVSEVTKPKESIEEKQYSPKAANAENNENDGSETKQLAAAGDGEQNQKQNRPQTEEGGVLPDTAGNDLNGVLLGSALSMLGSVYVLRKNKVESS